MVVVGWNGKWELAAWRMGEASSIGVRERLNWGLAMALGIWDLGMGVSVC